MIDLQEFEVRGWKLIAQAIGVSVRAAQGYAGRERDPLPVYLYLGRVVAHATALRDWCDRQRRPLDCRPRAGRKIVRSNAPSLTNEAENTATNSH